MNNPISNPPASKWICAMCTFAYRTYEAKDCPLCDADSTNQHTKEGLENLLFQLSIEPSLTQREVKEAMAGYQ